MLMKNYLNSILESRNSKKYQKTLSAFRVYYEFVTQQRRYSFIILLILAVIIIASIVGIISKVYVNKNLDVYGYSISVLSNLLFVVVILIIGIWEEHRFKIGKSIIIILTNKLNFIILLFFIVLVSLITFTSESVSFVFYILLIIEVVLVLIVMSVLTKLQRNSLITFAIEQIDNIRNSKDKDKKYIISRYQLYYYSIYVYYHRIKKEIKEVYKENVENIIGIKYLLLLGSQIFNKDPKYREELYGILKKLEKIDPIINNDEFMDVIKKIRIDFNKYYYQVYDKDPDESVFYQQTTWSRIKPKLMIILTIITFFISNISILAKM